MVQIAVSGLKTIAYLTKRYTVGKLAEYHTHKVTPCVETLDMFVRTMLFICDLINSFSNFYLCEKSYLCHEGRFGLVKTLR